MPRKPSGDHALTPAERQAHQRAKRKAQWEHILAALKGIAEAEELGEAQLMARVALGVVNHLAP